MTHSNLIETAQKFLNRDHKFFPDNRRGLLKSIDEAILDPWIAPSQLAELIELRPKFLAGPQATPEQSWPGATCAR